MPMRSICLLLFAVMFASPAWAKPKAKKSKAKPKAQSASYNPQLLLQGRWEEALGSFSGKKKLKPEDQFVLARIHDQLGRDPKVQLEAAEGVGPALRDWRLYYLGRAYLRSGDRSQAEQAFAALQETPLREAAARGLKLARCSQEALDPAWLRAELDPELVRDLSNSGCAPSHREALKSLYLSSTLEWPEAITTQFGLSPEERMRRAQFLVQARRPELAVPELRQVSETGEALADAYFQARQYPEAAAAYARLRERMGSAFSSQMQERLAQAYGRSDQFDKAAQAYRDLANLPHHLKPEDIPFRLAFLAMDSGNAEVAVQAWEALLTQFPRHPQREAVLWYLAWLNYRLGRDDVALTYFDQLASAYPKGRFAPRLGYWRARIAERQGRHAQALELWRQVAREQSYSYYGMLSLKRLEKHWNPEIRPKTQWMQTLRRAALPAAPSWKTLSSVHARDSAAQKTIRELLRLGLWEEALSAMRQTPATQLSADWRALGAELALSTKVSAGDKPSLATHPMPYAQWLRWFSGVHELKPALAWAIAREESHFRPDIVSASEAIGLMQIIPPTGLEIAGALGRHFAAEDLRDPAVNIDYGIYYLRQNQKRFSGNLIATIASYNGGPHNVERWLKARGELDWDEFVEEIPYRETQDYVRKVLRSFYIYEVMLGG